VRAGVTARRLQLMMAVAALVVLVALAAGSTELAAPNVVVVGTSAPRAPTPPGAEPTVARPASPIKASTTAVPRVVDRQVHIITDSVVLGAEQKLRERLAGWDVGLDGRLALTVSGAEAVLRKRSEALPRTVVVALGYRSNWERNRRRYDTWAHRFDQDADRLVATLRSLGVEHIVWVTLRELEPDSVPGGWGATLSRYGFYFPYVNERLHALVERNPDVTLADWQPIAARPGVTFDAVHLNDRGRTLMAAVIARALGA
jgi:hypothetical protein